MIHDSPHTQVKDVYHKDTKWMRAHTFYNQHNVLLAS